MQNIFKNEGIFILGATLLIALISGSYYLERGAHTEDVQTQASPATVLNNAVEVATSSNPIINTPANTTPAPAIHYPEREYDDD